MSKADEDAYMKLNDDARDLTIMLRGALQRAKHDVGPGYRRTHADYGFYVELLNNGEPTGATARVAVTVIR